MKPPRARCTDSRHPVRSAAALLAAPLVLCLAFVGTLPVPALAAGAANANTILISGSSTAKPYWHDEAVSLGFTVEVADDASWNAKSTADFATYKAIVIPDRSCSGPSATAVNSRATWSPAVTGNILVVGGDPDYHVSYVAGAVRMVRNGIAFAAADPGHTGAFLPLGCSATTTILDGFGSFTGGTFGTDTVHVVAIHPALDGLDDAALSNWRSSTHVGFSSYPADFKPLAIQPTNYGAGRLCFADASCGVPFLLAKGTGLQSVGLNVSASAPASVAFGTPITYTITYGNTGSSAASSVVITNAVPAGTTFVSATGGGSLVGANVIWNIASLGGGVTGQTVTFTVMPTVSGDITNAGYTIEGASIAPVVGPTLVTNVTAPVGIPQSITFGTAPSIAYGGTGNVTATGGASGNPVVFTSLTSSTCAVTGSAVSGIAVGTCTIAANQAGGSGYLAAPQVTQSFAIASVNQAIAFGDPPAIVFGGSGNVTATGGASGNPVVFSSRTPSTCTVAGRAVSGIAAGPCTIAANQAGNGNFNPAPEATQSFTIGKATQSITFRTAPAITFGGTGIVSASGGTQGNPIIFSSLTPATCSIAGNVVTGIAAGTCTIAANLPGDDNYHAATQVTQDITIGKAAQSIAFGTAPAIPLGQSGTVFASGGESGNPVVFSSLTNAVCTVAGSQVTALAQGLCIISASQDGNANYEAALQAKQSIDIGRLTPTLGLRATPAPARYRAAVTLVAQASGDFGAVRGEVSFHRGDEVVPGCGNVPLDEGRATCVSNRFPVGMHALVARFGGDANYDPAQSAAASLVVKATNPGSHDRDVAGDGRAAVFYETANGGLSIQLVKGRVPSDGQNLLPEGSGWHVVGFANFDGDATPEIFLEHDDGRFQVMSLEHIGIERSVSFVQIDKGTKVLAFADFDADGRDDLIVKRPDGSLAIHLMNGVVVDSTIEVSLPGEPVEFLRVADLDGEGHVDMILQTPEGLRFQRTHIGHPAEVVDLQGPGPAYRLTHAGDFDGDGRTDLLFEDGEGHVAIWRMNGMDVAYRSIVDVPALWRVTDVADFDGSFGDDLIFVGPDGEVAIGYLDARFETVSLGTLAVASKWKLWQVADYDGDGSLDLMFVSDTGEVVAALYRQGMYVDQAVLHHGTHWSVIP